MSWTAPATVATSDNLTAAFWNAQVRDNMLETAAATADAAGDLVYADAANSMGSRLAHPGASNRRLVSDGASSLAWRAPPDEDINSGGPVSNTSYTDEYDSGGGSLPSVTVTTGTSAIVIVSCQGMGNSSSGVRVAISFSISGASSLIASDGNAARVQVADTAEVISATSQRLVSLTAGSNIFQMEARVSGGAGTIVNPRILVIPL